mmetsp:Transcript_8610/g.37978  ORF Transcript_8610/g.37978 Transcript_8610/m.37978 type:complete len:324 (+) Transcript_8610:348-1319(+)
MASVRASTAASMLSSSSSRFSDLYLASFALTDSNLAFISSGSVAARPPGAPPAAEPSPSWRADADSYSPTTWLRRCASLSLLVTAFARLAAIVLATCACWRSWTSASRLAMASDSSSSSSRTSAESLLTSDVCAAMSESVRTSERKISRTDSSLARFFANSAGSFSSTSCFRCDTSSTSCCSSAAGDPDARDCLSSLILVAARLRRRSARSRRSVWSLVCLASSCSCACSSRRDCARATSSSNSRGSVTRCATFPFVTSIRRRTCSRSRSRSAICDFSLTGSFASRRARSHSLCASTNALCSSWVLFIRSWISGSMAYSPGTA